MGSDRPGGSIVAVSQLDSNDTRSTKVRLFSKNWLVRSVFVAAVALGTAVSGFATVSNRKVSHGPTFPPDPWENKVAHGPTFPPDPWENKVAHGPTFPPDPWESRAR